jgi:hypothetical protein
MIIGSCWHRRERRPSERRASDLHRVLPVFWDSGDARAGKALLAKYFKLSPPVMHVVRIARYVREDSWNRYRASGSGGTKDAKCCDITLMLILIYRTCKIGRRTAQKKASEQHRIRRQKLQQLMPGKHVPSVAIVVSSYDRSRWW